ncbi:MAG: aldehyde dehydrogenase family protein, partial [Marivivens sp.]|uniref:aldehyde dehydrogenase family protein n=1 Tax=Marivivens sp. TaxID=1978374 RepID=UPI0017B0B222
MPETNLKSLLSNPALVREEAYLAGEWVMAQSGATFDVINPARGDVIAKVADISREETAKVIDAAYDAQKSWAAKTGKERAKILRKWFDLMIENQEDLAIIMTAEQGKPLAEASGDVAYGASFVEW